MIKLLRIDDRLVHGQVALTWVPSLGVDYLIVANDKAANDEFMKMTLNLAKPASAKLLIKTVPETITLLKDPKGKNLKIMVLVNCIHDAFTIASDIDEITSVNFGGIRAKEGSKPISKAISVTDQDIVTIKQMIEKGLELEIRQVPTDKPVMVQTLI